jgi:hypothetical protein
LKVFTLHEIWSPEPKEDNDNQYINIKNKEKTYRKKGSNNEQFLTSIKTENNIYILLNVEHPSIQCYLQCYLYIHFYLIVQCYWYLDILH